MSRKCQQQTTWRDLLRKTSYELSRATTASARGLHTPLKNLTLHSLWFISTCTSQWWSSFHQTPLDWPKITKIASIFCSFSIYFSASILLPFWSDFGQFFKPNTPPWSTDTNCRGSLLEGSSKRCFLGSDLRYLFSTNQQIQTASIHNQYIYLGCSSILPANDKIMVIICKPQRQEKYNGMRHNEKAKYTKKPHVISLQYAADFPARRQPRFLSISYTNHILTARAKTPYI